MEHAQKLSLWSAILINLNIMFGTGIYINTVNLAKLTGALGFVSYALSAILVFPLILAVSELIRIWPIGGFYTYGSKGISPIMGFISSWSYFTGKLGSVPVLIHVFTSLMQTIIPTLQTIPVLILDSGLIIFFALLNMLKLETGTRILYGFIILKLIPILFTILSSIYLYQFWDMPPETFFWRGIPISLPLVLFTFVGFEAAVSLSGTIENAQINAPKAILYSFFSVVTINIVYQYLFFSMLNLELINVGSYLHAFPALLHRIFPFQPTYASHMINVVHIAIAVASLGGSYGILFSNQWNLKTLAEHNHVFFAGWLNKVNKHFVPVACVMVEAIICIFYLLATNANQIILQQLSVFGCTIAYLISVIALVNQSKSNIAISIHPIVMWSALLSCFIFIIACIRNFIITGIAPLILSVSVIGCGIGMYFIKKQDNR